jgi:hypothetical protein
MVTVVDKGEAVGQGVFGPVNLLPGESYEFAGKVNGSGSELLLTLEDAQEKLISDSIAVQERQ